MPSKSLSARISSMERMLAAFILIAPPATFEFATAFFCFIVSVLTCVQRFSFALRRGLAGTATG